MKVSFSFFITFSAVVMIFFSCKLNDDQEGGCPPHLLRNKPSELIGEWEIPQYPRDFAVFYQYLSFSNAGFVADGLTCPSGICINNGPVNGDWGAVDDTLALCWEMKEGGFRADIYSMLKSGDTLKLELDNKSITYVKSADSR